MRFTQSVYRSKAWPGRCNRLPTPPPFLTLALALERDFSLAEVIRKK